MNLNNYITYYLPEKIVTNNDLAKEFPEWHADKIEEKVGIRTRHVVSENETALDLATQVCNKILNDSNRSGIDFLILCTQSPDYFLPTSACILQDRIGLSQQIGAFDFNLGCSGYIYGLAIAKGLIESKIAHTILFVTAETYSKHIHPLDKGNRSIFGDASTATLLDENFIKIIGEFELGTDGKGFSNLIVKNGGLRNKFRLDEQIVSDADGNVISDNYLYMDGPEIFNFTIETIPTLVKNVLEKNKISLEEIDYFIFHQANKFMLDYLRKKLKIDPLKFYMNMLNTGNTVSSTIPIALTDAYNQGLIRDGNKVLIAGFGVGYSWGATIITI